MTTHKYQPICDGSVKSLALGIVLQAVDDWRKLIECEVKGKLPPDTMMSFGELRRFFRSDECELLLTDTPLTGGKILRQLEAERRDAIDNKGMATISAEA